MNANPNRTRTIRLRALALLGGGVVAGVIGASALNANAQNTAVSTATGTTSTSTGSTSTTPSRGNSNETTVTGAKATALKAAALKQVPGATVNRISTEDPAENTGAAYEIHITTSAGQEQTLLFNSAYKYLSTETGGRGGHGGPGGHGGRNGETAVTGTNATTLKNAALAKVPGATVEEVTTDSGDATYEVHLKKADGSEVTVKFDKNLAYVSTETGRGK